MRSTARSIVWQLLIYVVSAVVIVAVLLQTDITERLAYRVEKGRLRALHESMPTAQELAVLNASGREVAAAVGPAVVAVICERNFDLSQHPPIRLHPDSLGHDVDTNGDVDSNALGPPQNLLQRFRSGDSRMTVPAGYGSGFVVDAERGHVITNNHVIDAADAITVQLADGRRFDAQVLGTDPKSDLALIRIEADDLHELRLADSDLVEVGDEVMAVGNPFGLSGTFSRGIISGKGRSSVSIHGAEYRSFLQTDAVINPGNSGGPLVDASGQVIGVNTAIATETGHYDGVGFAIPSKRIVQVLPALAAGRLVQRGYLGVSIVGVTGYVDWSRELGWDGYDGVIVREVLPNTPAATCGLRRGDMIVEIDGQRLRGTADLIDIVGAVSPGQSLDLLLWREREFVMQPVVVAAQPKNFSTRIPRSIDSDD